MPGIHDYLVWRGDLPITPNTPLNEVDALILARLSYFPFEQLPPHKSETGMTVGDICEILSHAEEKKFRINGDIQLTKDLKNCPRFKDLLITDYAWFFDAEKIAQFGAITIHLPDGSLFLSFIGTDSTLVGWQEDLYMSFTVNLPCQLLALDYTLNIMAQYPDAPLFFGGHSKGGNVAMYAAAKTPAALQGRITAVRNFDGPGFPAEFIELSTYQSMVGKAKTFIPQDSVIGRLMEHGEAFEVVESTANGIYQHDVYSWEVLGTRLVRAETTTDNSDLIDKTLRRVLEETPPEQRKVFLDNVFGIARSGKATTVKDLRTNLLLEWPLYLKGITSLDEETAATMNSVLADVRKAYFATLSETGIEKIGKSAKDVSESKLSDPVHGQVAKFVEETENWLKGITRNMIAPGIEKKQKKEPDHGGNT